METPKNNGIHRAKTWEIGFFALNNCSTNSYMIMVMSISYYLIGIVGLGAVLAGSIVTIMRIWDGVTDPFVGMLVDKTDGKFGKNRPFIVIGQIIMFTMTFLMFRLVPRIPTGGRFIAFIVLYAIYIIGYTFQCVITKSAQSCLTNDPKQRPQFAAFDSVFNVLYLSVFYPVYFSGTLIPKFTLTSVESADKIAKLVAQNPNLANTLTTAENGVQTLSGFYNPEMWQYMQLVFAGLSALFAIIAIIGLWRKDNKAYFGITNSAKVTLRDYADVLAHNRAIQMLMVAASTDKLATTIMTNATVMVCLFGIVCDNYAYYASYSALTAIPVMLISVFGINRIACRLGQKKSVTIGSFGAIAFAICLLVLLLVGNPSSMVLPAFSLTKPATWAGMFSASNWSLFGVLFIVLFCLMKGFSNLAGYMTIPMTAECTDYEVYRSGRYLPGLMGTLYSFVDKLISSFASTLSALMFALVGFSQALPTLETPYSRKILMATVVCWLGAPIFGWICNLIAMHFYPLTKEKMEEIQNEIAKIKAEAEVSNA